MLAVLYDIHANLSTLERVLAEAETAGADGYLLGTDLVNPGSVGMPLDGDVRAAWALWNGDFEFRRTGYDRAPVAAAYRALGTQFGEFAARRIARGSD